MMPLLRWLTGCPLQFAVFNDSQIALSYASGRKKQPVLLMEHYAHISTKIINFNAY